MVHFSMTDYGNSSFALQNEGIENKAASILHRENGSFSNKNRSQ
jgi:hypothetical protein